VSHIPELTMYINYPPSYPSHSPPDVHVSARWMDASLNPPISDHLKSLYVPGCPVVYEWVMYLQDSLVQDYSRLSSSVDAQKGDKEVCKGGVWYPGGGGCVHSW
jgi:hypothetical protein